MRIAEFKSAFQIQFFQNLLFNPHSAFRNPHYEVPNPEPLIPKYMFFFIAGIQPKTKAVDKTPRLCPACGLQQAYLKRTDHYLSLFFIPLFPVKQGDSFLICENCERLQHEGRERYELTYREPAVRCTSCGRLLEKGFSYCPYCGRAV